MPAPITIDAYDGPQRLVDTLENGPNRFEKKMIWESVYEENAIDLDSDMFGCKWRMDMIDLHHPIEFT